MASKIELSSSRLLTILIITITATIKTTAIRINIKGFYNGFNNFGFEDTYEESNYNSFINNIIDINENEILSFGTRLGERYIASIWDRNKYYDRQNSCM